ncbi:hypothetical protein [Lunatimonas salinarum]|uniref:hypothetical protein n=1 Tax=Lunatimonas salinarum TaxID=1774590 RepID=UPI001AE08284|nr:hypothetical protein [Lunatimonas salinarum]
MLIIDGKLHFSYKVIFSLLSIFGFFIIYEQVLIFLQIEEFNNENIDELFNTTTTNLSYGRSFVDMSGYPYPLKLFTFLYRPLFFDAHNISSFINSIENAICLALTIVIFTKVNPLKGYKQAPNAVKIMLLTFLLASIAFAGALSNFGIIVRMKNMTFVYFLFFLVFIYDRHIYGIRLSKYKRYLAQRQKAHAKTPE